MAPLRRLAAAALLALAATGALAGPAIGQSKGQSGAARAPPTLEPLGPQQLTPGQCGLFLWSRLAQQRDRELVAIIGGEPASIYVRVSGRITRVPRTSVGGAGIGAGLALHPEQRFQGDTMSATVRLTLAAPPTATEPAQVRGGVVAFRGPGGWETVTPVSGEVRCTSARR